MDDHGIVKNAHLRNAIDHARRQIDALDPKDPQQGLWRRSWEEKVEQWTEWQNGEPAPFEEEISRVLDVNANAEAEIQQRRARMAALETLLATETNPRHRLMAEQEMQMHARNIAELAALNERFKQALDL
ncbi:hypothetical protein [Paraburkholderia unamae]|uniref:Uncharacterized protein n=2 Tax=Paraburkholderia unamae TaxID=219649 RepID=A0ABX5KDR9_9BURK|nr:hypothetical protein [Paraburkholderia unamae]PVX70726.1 hypothetical protein C7402_13530 [Paraburkholderia unamae]RAR50732.1 hypothetical protein C7401_14048 [Paraburkholderia unamae]